MNQHYYNSLIKQFHTLVKEVCTHWQVPNLTYALISQNEIIGLNSYTLDQFYPYDVNNKIFRIGSNSKAMACAILADLEYQKKLSLEDSVINYLPKFKMGTKELTNETKVVDLVTHATGVSKYAASMMCYLDYSHQDIINCYQHFKPVKPYRSSFQYNNGLYVVAAELIKQVTGIRNEDYFKEKLFQPLGMNNTYTSLNTLYKPALAVPHVDHDGKSIAIPQCPFGDAISIGGNVNSTAADLAQWLLFNLKITTTDDPALKQYKKIFKSQIKISTPKSTNLFNSLICADAYTLGWYRACFNKYTFFEHMGGFSGYMSNISFSPQLKSGIILLSNKSDIWYPLEMLKMNYYELLINNYYTNMLEAIKQQCIKFRLSLNQDLSVYKKEVIPSYLKIKNGSYFNPIYGKIVIHVDENLSYIILGPKAVIIKIEYIGNNIFKLIDEHFNFGTMFKLILLEIKDTRKKLTLTINMDDQHGHLAWIDTQDFVINE